MAKFDQIRLKDLGARRVDDRHTHRQTDRQTHRQTDRHTDRHTDKQTQAIIRAILRIGPTNAGNNKGNPSDRAKKIRLQRSQVTNGYENTNDRQI